ncbi:hypothetical protein HAX54_028844, partial [Datura stramonium]|nr:hypothetical protein [Datura stramonium]
APGIEGVNCDSPAGRREVTCRPPVKCNLLLDEAGIGGGHLCLAETNFGTCVTPDVCFSNLGEAVSGARCGSSESSLVKCRLRRRCGFEDSGHYPLPAFHLCFTIH